MPLSEGNGSTEFKRREKKDEGGGTVKRELTREEQEMVEHKKLIDVI